MYICSVCWLALISTQPHAVPSANDRDIGCTYSAHHPLSAHIRRRRRRCTMRTQADCLSIIFISTCVVFVIFANNRRTLMATHFWSFLALFQCVVINAALRDVGSNFKSYICVYIVAVTAHSFELAICWSALNLKILWRSHAFALVFDRQSGKTCTYMQYEPDYRSVKLI